MINLSSPSDFQQETSEETDEGFRNEYFFLSNFSPSLIEIEYRDNKFVMGTGEHVFQAMKISASSWSEQQKMSWLNKLSKDNNPMSAKRLGRTININRNKWDSSSYRMMERTQELKYSQNTFLKNKLIETGNVKLVEYNTWKDLLWGADLTTREGKNQLGVILMSLRANYAVAFSK